MLCHHGGAGLAECPHVFVGLAVRLLRHFLGRALGGVVHVHHPILPLRAAPPQVLKRFLHRPTLPCGPTTLSHNRRFARANDVKLRIPLCELQLLRQVLGDLLKLFICRPELQGDPVPLRIHPVLVAYPHTPSRSEYKGPLLFLWFRVPVDLVQSHPPLPPNILPKVLDTHGVFRIRRAVRRLQGVHPVCNPGEHLPQPALLWVFTPFQQVHQYRAGEEHRGVLAADRTLVGTRGLGSVDLPTNLPNPLPIPLGEFHACEPLCCKLQGFLLGTVDNPLFGNHPQEPCPVLRVPVGVLSKRNRTFFARSSSHGRCVQGGTMKYRDCY
eukprot:Sspe_Gene.83321::Locus_54654_Transcript_1_4_Confidence_0.400_Length_1089::g.83321::m.83321